ncbi:hypothetical protein LTR62_001304 [Meristemomyces frigidus]|uniref:Uncharacterized protein n=1 Tax=Meristemomyces frigidus TaxID=1508187 RepID=A0AAN7YMG6_9PEZI|nr:hypothetical protein LTR62_001304 [Meristemomyces frigidus]
MARSPSDATRFTSTGPYASSSPSFNSSSGPKMSSGTTIDFGIAPANETPQQKVQRMRAAAASARRGKESGFDIAVRIGRIWADRSHRVATFGLIGLTVASACIATAGITDMLLHNRRKRNDWLAEQQAKTARDLAEARTALGEGRVTEDQMLLINRQRAADEAAEAKRTRPGVVKRVGGWLFSDVNKEETKGGRLAGGVQGATQGTVDAVREAVQGGQRHDRSVLQSVEEKVEAGRTQIEEVARTRFGGPLDREAQATADAVMGSSRSWIDRLMGR